MSKWRNAFEFDLPPQDEREDGEVYTFGPPATAKQLAEVERELKLRLPADVRELLSEFNGVWVTYEYDSDPDLLYLTTKAMMVDVPDHIRNSGNHMPPDDQLGKVVFVAQSNGFGALFAVCLSDFARFKTGEVVMLDHEKGEFEKYKRSLMEFVQKGCKLT